ncbi:MAG: hypothetical protein ACE5G1_07375 [bacterium]
MIKANCRDKFNAEDFEFIASSVAKNPRNRTALAELLTDRETRDQVLDDADLFQALTSESGLSNISPYLYFYVLTRRAFLENEIDDRDTTDYVACLLAEFCSLNRVHRISHHHSKPYHYLTDMMTDFVEASSPRDFLIRSHLGNYALFITGLFPDFIYRKATYGRKAPGFEYYESMGRSSYKWASRHQMAVECSLVEILATLAEQFRNVRIALNMLADNYVALRDRAGSLDQALRQIFFGKKGPDSFEA